MLHADCEAWNKYTPNHLRGPRKTSIAGSRGFANLYFTSKAGAHHLFAKRRAFGSIGFLTSYGDHPVSINLILVSISGAEEQ